jgi:hypothetical protein
MELGLELREAPSGDGLPHPLHKLLIIMEVMPGKQHRRDDLAGPEHMVQIGPAE